MFVLPKSVVDIKSFDFQIYFILEKQSKTSMSSIWLGRVPASECYHSNILWSNLGRIFEYSPTKEGCLPASDIFYQFFDQMWKGYLNISQQRKGLCKQVIPPYDCDRVCDGLHLGGAADYWGDSGTCLCNLNLLRFTLFLFLCGWIWLKW